MFGSERVVIMTIMKMFGIFQIALDDISHWRIWLHGHDVQFLDFPLAQKPEIADGKWLTLRMSIQIVSVEIGDVGRGFALVIPIEVRVVGFRIPIRDGSHSSQSAR